MRDKVFEIVWQVMKDHYFEGSTGEEDDREYANQKTDEIMEVLKS